MADSVNLADEFAPPETTVTPPSATTTGTSQPEKVDLFSEFAEPPKKEQYAIINDATDKFHLWKEADRTQRGLLLERWFPDAGPEIKRSFWEVQNTPLIQLPQMNPGADVDIPVASAGTANPAIITGAYNGAAKILSGLTTPINIETMGVFGALVKAAQGVGPAAQAAKYALTTIKTYFGATMAKGAGEALGAASVEQDKSQKTSDIVEGLAQGAFAALSAGSAIHDVLAPKTAISTGEPTDANKIESPTAEVRSNPEPAAPREEVAAGTPGEPQSATGASEAKSAPVSPQEALADYTRYHEIQAEWKRLMDEGKDASSPEIQKLWRENEDIKNRYDGFPPTPPEVPNLSSEFEPPKSGTEENAVLTEELQKNEAPKPVEPESTNLEAIPPEGGITGIRNAIVDQERAARGLPEAMKVAAREFPDVWDEATKRLDEHPEAGEQLVQELIDKPRALSDTENAILLHRQIAVQNEFDKISERIVNGGEEYTPEQMSEDKVRLAKLSDDLLDIYNAGKTAGTEQGRGLNARKLLAAEDYSLAKMVTNRRAVNDGRPLTPEQMSEVEALHKKITDTQKAFDDYRSRMSELLMKEEPTAQREPRRQKAPGSISRFISDRAEEARARIMERMKSGRVLSGIDPADLADHVIVGADYIAKGISELGAWSSEMVKEFGEAITPHLQTIFDRSKQLWNEMAKAKADDARLKAVKTRSINQAYDLEKKILEGDFSPKQKPAPIPLDKEAQKLAAEALKAKQEFQTALIRDQLENRTPSEKVQDTIVRWRRGFLLSGPITLAKLTGAAVLRVATTPLEELVGSGLGKVVPQLMERAPRHGGGFSVEAEAKAITEGLTQGMKDAAQKLREGKSDLDTLFGRGANGRITESDVIPQSFIDFFGHVHAALKAPVERSEFTRSLQKRIEFAIRMGQDVHDPMVQTQMSVAAYKDAKRAIFMQDNIVSKGFNAALATLENAKSDGSRSAVGKGIATTMRVLFPIVKVPTNIVAEAMEYATGSVTGSAKLAKAFRDGIEKLEPEQADVIARQLKKGLLGAAALAFGYYYRDHLGGFYQQGEHRPKTDVKPGAARIGDVDIGKSLIHSSLMEAVQLGATVGRIQDTKIKGKHPEIADAIGESVLGLIEETPFIRTPIELSKLFDKKDRPYAEGELVKGLVVPQLVSGTATLLDKDANGNPVVRKPKTILQHVETGIPGLRETVPAKR